MTSISSSGILLPIALSFLFFGLGYRIGSSAFYPRSSVISNEIHELEEVNSLDDSEDQEAIPDGDLGAIQAGFLVPCKLALVVRTDLKLSSGDIASHCSQATINCYSALIKKNKSLVRHWETTGQAKISLKSRSEDQLLELWAIAKSLNLCARIVKARDVNGVPDGTPIVLGVGPAPVALVNEVTGKLRLL